jgi:adenylate cyclase class 2
MPSALNHEQSESVIMADNVETEVKLYVPHLEWVQVRLEGIGAKLTAPRVYERNVRFENTAKTLTTEGVVLRLRHDKRNRLTYKEGGNEQDGIISRTEIEVEVSDFDAMQTILMKLGYSPHMIYEKFRTTYEIDGAEVVLDEMPYGNFMEIEGDQPVIESLLKRIGLEAAPRLSASYSTLFDRVKQQLGLSFNDLTFENFKSIDVPEKAFQASAS